MRGIFLLLFLKFALVLNTFVKATSFNISITRGNKDHVDEKRDFITLPPVLCENVRNSCPKKVAAVRLTYSEAKKSCKCMCYGCKIFSEKWNECVRPEEIRRDEGITNAIHYALTYKIASCLSSFTMSMLLNLHITVG